jgi:hypothetical protein
MSLAAGPAGAAEAKRSLAPIYPIENAIKTDGNVIDWEWAPSLGIGKFGFPISIAEHGTVARFLARYDAECLYVAFRVTDFSPALNRWLQQDRWQGDQVELLLCTDPKEHSKHGSFSRHDYQFFIGPTREGKGDVYVNINGEKRAYAVPGSEAAQDMGSLFFGRKDSRCLWPDQHFGRRSLGVAPKQGGRGTPKVPGQRTQKILNLQGARSVVHQQVRHGPIHIAGKPPHYNAHAKGKRKAPCVT